MMPNDRSKQLRSRGSKITSLKSCSPQQIGKLINGMKQKRHSAPSNGFVVTEVEEQQLSVETQNEPKSPKRRRVRSKVSMMSHTESLNGSCSLDSSQLSEGNLPCNGEEKSDIQFPQFVSNNRIREKVVFRQVQPKTFEVQFLKSHQLYFHGRVRVALLEGSASILGWPLTPNNPMTVFSSRGSSLIGIDGQPGTILQLQKFHSHLDDCLRKLHHIGLFSGSKDKASGHKPAPTARILAERSLDCRFLSEDSGEKVVVLDQRWEGPIDQLLFYAKMPGFQAVMAGGKDVGKSTLLRIMSNKILSQQPINNRGVLILDFDPGQSEFTPPGCISLVEITEPLLGPSFTNQKRPLKSFFLGQVDVTRCLKEYKNAVRLLVNMYAELKEKKPLLVNTMGFNSGIGVGIMSTIVRLCMANFPVNVINIKSHLIKRNYPDGTFGLGSNCRVIELPSAAGKSTSFKTQGQSGMPPSVQREICLLSYLSPIVRAPNFSVLQTPPYVIRLGHLVLGVTHEYVHPNLVLEALVGSLVALCKIDENDSRILSTTDGNSLVSPKVISKPVPSLPCYGYGIVCGIDLPAGQLFLQTPEGEEQIGNVNCLLLSAIQLPSAVRRTGVQGTVPFVCQDSGLETSAPVRTVFRPIASLFEKKTNLSC